MGTDAEFHTCEQACRVCLSLSSEAAVLGVSASAGSSDVVSQVLLFRAGPNLFVWSSAGQPPQWRETMTVTKVTKMQNELAQYFIPMVREELARVVGNFTAEFEVDFIERMTQVNGIRFEMVIEPTGKTFTVDFLKVVMALDALCQTDSNENYELDGYKFLLGDGDDSQAVWFENGAFHIWLRGWKE